MAAGSRNKSNSKITVTLRCANPVCAERVHFPKKYCSRRCSAHVRNRRYYLTERGRLKKRAGQSRYFQKHRAELYAKKAARFQRYERETVARLTAGFDAGPALLSDERFRRISDPESIAREAHYDVRVKHDWHGGLYDGPIGRPIYVFLNGKPELIISTGRLS